MALEWTQQQLTDWLKSARCKQYAQEFWKLGLNMADDIADARIEDLVEAMQRVPSGSTSSGRKADVLQLKVLANKLKIKAGVKQNKAKPHVERFWHSRQAAAMVCSRSPRTAGHLTPAQSCDRSRCNSSSTDNSPGADSSWNVGRGLALEQQLNGGSAAGW